VAPRLAHPSDLWPQTPPCFLPWGVGRRGAAPSTHQDQGLWTSRWRAKRLPLVPVVPQKTVGALLCPIVDRSQMSWLPGGSRFPRAHGRGVATLPNPVAGHRSWGEVRTHQTPGCNPYCLPVSHPTPTRGLPSATGFRDIKGHEVAHHVVACPCQYMDYRLPRTHQVTLGLFPLVKPLH
jgi:hypothetical protein